MKSINHQQIRLIREDLTAYETIIECDIPLPKFIIDSNDRLFLKNRTIFESGKSKVVYSQALATFLSTVEVQTVEVQIKMTVQELISILEKCPLDAGVNFDHADRGTFRISPITYVELDRADNSIYLYEDLVAFDRFRGECVEIASIVERAPNFIETTYREAMDNYAGEAILDRFIDPEELNVDR